MKTYFSIPPNLYKAISSEAKSHAGVKERGGILIGEFRGPHIAITEMTLPGKDDEGSLFRFIRKDRSHQKRAMAAWRQSNKTKTFVGEWHTHPSGTATPSSIDKKTWKRLTMDARTPLIFIIAAPNDVGIFRGEMISLKRKRKFKLERLDIEVSD